MRSQLLDQIFNLKFTSKQLVRAARKCEKEEKDEKLKIKKAIEKGAAGCGCWGAAGWLAGWPAGWLAGWLAARRGVGAAMGAGWRRVIAAAPAQLRYCCWLAGAPLLR